MHVKLYEDIARHGHIATTYAYPVKVEGRYVMDPSPIPKFDNPKMDQCAALQLFGAGREKRIYAIPPHTSVVSLDFEDHPFACRPSPMPARSAAATGVYLDEVITDDAGGRMFVCSDTDHCETPAERSRRHERSAAIAHRRSSSRRRRHEPAMYGSRIPALPRRRPRAVAGRGARRWSANPARARRRSVQLGPVGPAPAEHRCHPLPHARRRASRRLTR
jgi:hypothetical protein